jgi:hypothetical protein
MTEQAVPHQAQAPAGHQPQGSVRHALEKLIDALYWVPQTVQPGQLLERVSADPDTANHVVSRLGQALQAAQETLHYHTMPLHGEAIPDGQRDARQAPDLNPRQLQALRVEAALKQLQLQSVLLGEICGAIARAWSRSDQEEFALRAAHAAQTSVATAICALAACIKGAGDA